MNEFGGKAQAKCQFARVERLQSRGRIDRLAKNRFGMLLGDFFDFHAAGGAGHEYGLAGGAIHQNAHVEFALDVKTFFDQKAADDAAFFSRLRRDQLHAEDVLGKRLRLVGGTCELYPAGFAAAAGMNLRLHHDHGGAQPLCRAAGASSFLNTTSPRGTGTPNLARIALA